MRLKIRHETAYRFETPATGVIQTLRLTPRGHDGQHVIDWRLEVSRNCRLRAGEDAFGNLTHVFAIDGAVDEIVVSAEGEVETQDMAGMMRGCAERFPPELYLRETPLTEPDVAIADFAAGVAALSPDDRLATLHGLLEAVSDRMEVEREHAAAISAETTAAEAFRLKRGAARDLAHVFLVAARSLGVPARYVAGYVHRDEAPAAPDRGHGWAEAYAPGFGWIGFDPAENICPKDRHVRVAIGLDHLGAAPSRGARYGGEGETLDVTVTVEEARPVRSYRRVAQTQGQIQTQAQFDSQLQTQAQGKSRG